MRVREQVWNTTLRVAPREEQLPERKSRPKNKAACNAPGVRGAETQPDYTLLFAEPICRTLRQPLQCREMANQHLSQKIH